MAIKSLRDVEGVLAQQDQKMQQGFAQLQQTLLAVIAQANPQFALATTQSPAPATVAQTPPVPVPAAPVWVNPLADEPEDETQESVLAIHDAADLPAKAKPSTDQGPARANAVGTFRLRRSNRGGGGSITPSHTPKAKGLAGAPIFDDTTRKVKVKVRDQKTGVMVEEDKTAYLSDDSRNIAGPLLAQQYVTVEDTEETHASRGAKTVRLALIDEKGVAIPGTSSRLLFCTSESGSFMLRGSLSVTIPIVDDKGEKREIVFEPAARGEVYLMGKTLKKPNNK